MAREISFGGAPTGGEGAVEAAARRLDRALDALEARLPASGGKPGQPSGSDPDRARLTAELDAARARERALEGVAAEASAALGRAAAEVRAALAVAEPPAEDAGRANEAFAPISLDSGGLLEEPTASGEPVDYAAGEAGDRPDSGEEPGDVDLFAQPQRSA